MTFFLFGFTGTLSSFQKDNSNKSICLLVQIELISPLISSLVRGKKRYSVYKPPSLFFQVQVYRVHGFFLYHVYTHTYKGFQLIYTIIKKKQRFDDEPKLYTLPFFIIIPFGPSCKVKIFYYELL